MVSASGAEFGCGFGIFPEASDKILWIGPVQSLSVERRDYFFLPWQSFSLLLPQVVYFTEMYKIFSELTDQIDQAGLTDEQRERETEAKLSELRALSIVADDWGRKAVNPGRAPFMPLWMDCTLFRLLRPVSNRQNLIISLFPCGLINPHSSCTTLPCFILRLCNSKQLKCHIN